ncbi:hypothetical protein EV401DRAFT_1546385 [Pisolithus croceorrhizus]|nr:hypothetical protein EV401DRAFT_1546385 [Pisolithus croceorrhizus]
MSPETGLFVVFPVHQRTHDNDASRIRPPSSFAAAAQFGNPIQIVTPLIHDATRIIDRFIHLPGTAVIIQLLSSEQCGPAGIHQIVHHHGGNERNLPWLAFELRRSTIAQVQTVVDAMHGDSFRTLVPFAYVKSDNRPCCPDSNEPLPGCCVHLVSEGFGTLDGLLLPRICDSPLVEAELLVR